MYVKIRELCKNKLPKKLLFKKRDVENEQICWHCKNACGGCSWSRSLTPVNGWLADPIIIKDSVGDISSYIIKKCPEFIEG